MIDNRFIGAIIVNTSGILQKIVQHLTNLPVENAVKIIALIAVLVTKGNVLTARGKMKLK